VVEGRERRLRGWWKEVSWSWMGCRRRGGGGRAGGSRGDEKEKGKKLLAGQRLEELWFGGREWLSWWCCSLLVAFNFGENWRVWKLMDLSMVGLDVIEMMRAGVAGKCILTTDLEVVQHLSMFASSRYFVRKYNLFSIRSTY
jgi:hypothetical protein